MEEIAQSVLQMREQLQTMRLNQNKLTIQQKAIVTGPSGRGKYYVNSRGRKVYLKEYQRIQCDTPGLTVRGAMPGGPCSN